MKINLKKGINVDIILQSIGRDKSKDISFTVAETALQDAKAVIEESKKYNVKLLTVNDLFKI